MRLVNATCPHCGASLHVNPGATIAHCNSCGSTLLIDSSPQLVLSKNSDDAGQPTNPTLQTTVSSPARGLDIANGCPSNRNRERPLPPHPTSTSFHDSHWPRAIVALIVTCIVLLALALMGSLSRLFSLTQEIADRNASSGSIRTEAPEGLSYCSSDALEACFTEVDSWGDLGFEDIPIIAERYSLEWSFEKRTHSSEGYTSSSRTYTLVDPSCDGGCITIRFENLNDLTSPDMHVSEVCFALVDNHSVTPIRYVTPWYNENVMRKDPGYYIGFESYSDAEYAYNCYIQSLTDAGYTDSSSQGDEIKYQ